MGLKMRSRELGGMRNLSKYLLSRLTGHAGLDSSEITTSFTLQSWWFFIRFCTWITMKPSWKAMSLLLTLEISSNLKKKVKQRRYMVTLRKLTGLSRLAWLTISRIRSEEIGSLRLTAAVPRILLAADLTFSTNRSFHTWFIILFYALYSFFFHIHTAGFPSCVATSPSKYLISFPLVNENQTWCLQLPFRNESTATIFQNVTLYSSSIGTGD